MSEVKQYSNLSIGKPNISLTKKSCGSKYFQDDFLCENVDLVIRVFQLNIMYGQ